MVSDPRDLRDLRSLEGPPGLAQGDYSIIKKRYSKVGRTLHPAETDRASISIINNLLLFSAFNTRRLKAFP